MARTKRTFKGFRLHIGIFGRRNVGKSSLLNALTGQNVSIVSHVAGTTTDPVEKPMELLPLGPVLFIDTAGIDDEGHLGQLRIEKTRRVIERTDLAIIVVQGDQFGGFEQELMAQFQNLGTPFVLVFNKIDETPPCPDLLSSMAQAQHPTVSVSALSGAGLSALRKTLLDAAPEDFIGNPTIIGDLVASGDTVVMVVPIDKEAPKGRLILPQVQTIRDALDNHCACLVVKDNALAGALQNLKTPPALVITDSQAFLPVSQAVPPSVPMTSFSVLFSRFKGDLQTQVQGALSVPRLVPGDRVLVAEACSHHPIGEDIGRVKIPQWLNRRVGGELRFDTVQGNDFPDDLSPYRLIIHCGGCMFNRRNMMSRLLRCQEAGIPITNYGLVIAYSLGILERALSPFPEIAQLASQQQF
ncbi:MAG: [FeFe] hydrogenase H-cluster maturation GTPase HydF [Myxococcales bacterium]|jgi:[FeFe] hydrogenase H-cluster maturation GTPase HydF|nr:[FeFe] hydrogenase H-cluster maturation GTPase HydF [Myxococcales bacterium]